MPASPIRKLVPFAEAAKKKGIKVYHLNIGQPDIETPQQCLDAVKNCDIHVLEYSHSAGNESYRKKLVEYYSRNNIDITHQDIIVTTGGSEAILFGFMACLDAGDEVIIPANTFIASVLAVSDNNLTPVFVEPDLDTYNIDINKIEIVGLNGQVLLTKKLFGIDDRTIDMSKFSNGFYFVNGITKNDCITVKIVKQ